jgi:HD-GYP domain-containing protein (c-di-GMP phosphodiesterase class II)
MYLIGVDRSWLHTPFLRHKFKIKDQAEIDALLSAGIAQVTIDTEQGLDVVGDEPAVSSPVKPAHVESPPAGTPPASVAGSSSQPPAAMLAENLAKATQRRAEWVQRLNGLFEQARKTGFLQQDVVSQVIDEVIGDVLDRQDACYAALALRRPDPTLHEHGLTVCTLSVMLGKALDYNREELEQLGTGGMLHDIGLMRLPQNIVKRSSAMSPAQKALYDSHTTQGGALLEQGGSFGQAVLAIVKGHHNLIGQTGEKEGVAARGHAFARVVGIIDQYDELITGHTGFTPMSSHQALTQLYQRYRADEGLVQIVSYLIRVIGVYPLYSLVGLSSGELAVVGAITPGKAHLPLLYICRDQFGNRCLPPTPVDLIREPEGGRTIRDVRDAVREGLDVETILRQVAA